MATSSSAISNAAPSFCIWWTAHLQRSQRITGRSSTELANYSPELAAKPRITALNKIDALDKTTLATRRRALEKASGGPVMLMSGVSKEGVTDVLRTLMARIGTSKAKPEFVGDWHPG